MLLLIKESLRYLFVFIGGAIGFPMGFLSWLEKHLTTGEVVFNLFAQVAALFPGKPGNFVRTAYYMCALDYFHPTAVISFGSYFSKRGACVAAKAGIGAFCVVGLADIEASVRIASRVSVISGLHYHGCTKDIGSKIRPPVTIKRVHIGEGTWIGEGALVSANIGRGCIIAIGSVVTNDIPDFSMAMGNPARLLPVTGNKTDLSPLKNQMEAKVIG